ncbi:MAG: DUF2062 domain-containing protein [Verrucomicrobiales bacterium]
MTTPKPPRTGNQGTEEERVPREQTDGPAMTHTGRPSFWRRRLVDPLVAQLRQGVTPEKLALTLALGLALGCFPIIGSTTVLCAAAAVVLRLNQPIIHTINQLVYPLQLALLIPYYRMGEWLFRTPSVPLSLPLLFERFAADAWQFLQDYGLLALQGIAVWCLLAPGAIAFVYFATRDSLRVLARGIAR